MKLCRDCKTQKPVSEFAKANRNRDGLYSYCRSCSADRRNTNKRYYDKRRTRELTLKRLYGMSLDEYNLRFMAQGGKCAVCGDVQKRWLAVDHSHLTGKIRELLCDRCNPMAGYALDEPARLRAVADYLERHSA